MYLGMWEGIYLKYSIYRFVLVFKFGFRFEMGNCMVFDVVLIKKDIICLCVNLI